ncbi:MAG: hypothetical protein AAGD38_09420 [Acidobacteriota bacterium]
MCSETRVIKILMVSFFFMFVTHQGLAEVFSAPYWYLDGQTEAAIELANSSPDTHTTTPLLLLEGYKQVALDPVTLEPGQRVRLPLRPIVSAYVADSVAEPGRWGDGSRPGSLWGSARLEWPSHQALSGWIVMESEERGMSINSMFMPAGRASADIVGMWWYPTEGTHALFALQNQASVEIRVNTTVYVEGQRHEGPSFTLAASEARLISADDLHPQTRRVADGAIQFQVEGGSRALQGWTILVDEDTGLSTPLSMQPRDGRSSTHAEMAGALTGALKVAGLADVRFVPLVLLANPTDRDVRVELTLQPGVLFDYGKSDLYDSVAGIPRVEGPPGFSLEPLVLAPRETRVLALRNIDLDDPRTFRDGVIGIQLQHSGGPGDLFAEVLSVDETYQYVFHDPVVDVSHPPVTLTAISFDLSDDQNRILTLKNTTDLPTAFDLVVYFEIEGEETSYQTLWTLGPKAVAVIDLKALRASNLAGLHGTTFPHTIDSGHVMVRSPFPSLIGGDFAFDSSGSIASCFDICDCDPPGPHCFNQNPLICPTFPIGTPAHFGAGTYEGIFVNRTGTSCRYLICHVSGLLDQSCNGQTLTRDLSQFLPPESICPQGAGGDGISIRFPFVPTACFAVDISRESNPCL